MSLLVAPDPGWPGQAQVWAEEWRKVCGTGLIQVHHMGSTSVPGLPAKPIIDLMPVFTDTEAMMAAQVAVEAMGYEWMGAYGLPGRGYARRDDPATGKRVVQAHCYPQGHADIARHLAFRDALRANAPLRAAYTMEKARCAARHPEGGADYGRCKSAWIDRAESEALSRD